MWRENTALITGRTGRAASIPAFRRETETTGVTPFPSDTSTTETPSTAHVTTPYDVVVTAIRSDASCSSEATSAVLLRRQEQWLHHQPSTGRGGGGGGGGGYIDSRGPLTSVFNVGGVLAGSPTRSLVLHPLDFFYFESKQLFNRGLIIVVYTVND